MHEHKTPKQSRFNSLRRSRLGMTAAGLALTAAAALSVSALEQTNHTESLIPKDKVVQVEGKATAPTGFKAIHVNHHNAISELHGADAMEAVISARDSKGHECLYQFSISSDNGSPYVTKIANNEAELKGSYLQDAPIATNAAEVITLGNGSDTQSSQEFVLVQDPNSAHPFAYQVNGQ